MYVFRIHLQGGKRRRDDRRAGSHVLAKFERIARTNLIVIDEWEQRYCPMLRVARELVVTSRSQELNVV